MHITWFGMLPQNSNMAPIKEMMSYSVPKWGLVEAASFNATAPHINLGINITEWHHCCEEEIQTWLWHIMLQERTDFGAHQRAIQGRDHAWDWWQIHKDASSSPQTNVTGNTRQWVYQESHDGLGEVLYLERWAWGGPVSGTQYSNLWLHWRR